MGRVVIAKKAVLWRLDNILHSSPEIGSYTEYSKLRREIIKLRMDISDDGPNLEPLIKECKKT